jgi:hypothetical protein
MSAAGLCANARGQADANVLWRTERSVPLRLAWRESLPNAQRRCAGEPAITRKE